MIEELHTGRVLQLSLNRPGKRNALNAALSKALVDSLDAADADPGVGAILLRGNGPSFCAGMDLREALENDSDPLAGVHEQLFTTIMRLRKPLIAAVHGTTLAGGTGLVANAHIVVASPDAQFGLTEIRIGLWPVLVFRACALAMGERRATELSLTGRLIAAGEALQYGLVTEIAPDPHARALEIATMLSGYSANALGAGLEYVRKIRNQSWDEAGRLGREVRAELMAHPDFREASRRFLGRGK